MSTPHEASLTEKERAILAGLAAQAEADDPTLAATLRGRARRARRLPHISVRLRVPTVVSHWAWGVALAVLGLAVMVASLSVSLVLGIIGAVLTAAGTYRAVTVRLGRSEGDAHQVAPATSDN
jgi:hypothetical protein